MTDPFPVPEPRHCLPGWSPEPLPVDDGFELGCECAFPALQIEPWMAEQPAADERR